MEGRTIGIIVILVVVALGLWYVFSRPADGSITDLNTNGSIFNNSREITVTYSDTGFSPQQISVKEGDTVIWVNESSARMWIASANHPNHTIYNGTALAEHCRDGVPASDEIFDQCSGSDNGMRYSFTFDKVGEWNYHNHVNATRFGKVIVVAATSTNP